MKSAKHISLIFIAFFMLIFSACERLLIENDPEITPFAIYDDLWETVDQKYSFFEFKNINWDSLHTVHRARLSNQMTSRELFDVLADLLFELEDGHVNLITSFNLSRNWSWYENYPTNFDENVVRNIYLGISHQISGPLRNQVIDSVGYIYYSSFASGISPANIDNVIHRFRDMKGIVIDVRNNGGGSISNANILASRFTDEKRLTGFRLYKNGPAHNDFSEPVPLYIEPGGQLQFTEKPVVILTNRRSYSATNHFIMQMRTLPNVTVIGDNTGGGGGSPMNMELLNGWRYRFSSNITLDANNNNVEYGIAPDIYQNLINNNFPVIRDDIIERALDFIRDN